MVGEGAGSHQLVEAAALGGHRRLHRLGERGVMDEEAKLHARLISCDLRDLVSHWPRACVCDCVDGLKLRQGRIGDRPNERLRGQAQGEPFDHDRAHADANQHRAVPKHVPVDSGSLRPGSPEVIYEIPPSKLEPYFAVWEAKLASQGSAHGWSAKPHQQPQDPPNFCRNSWRAGLAKVGPGDASRALSALIITDIGALAVAARRLE